MRFEGEAFTRHYLDGIEGEIGDVRFDGCTFSRCSVLGKPYAPTRLRIRDVELVDCHVDRGVRLGMSWLTDVTVRNLKITGDIHFMFGMILERVTLAGRIDRIVIDRNVLRIGNWPAGARESLEAEADAAYSTMDWALDISQADTLELELRNIPGHLVRRNPETQAVVRRERVLGSEWEDIDYEKTWFHAELASLARGDYDSKILVTPTRKRAAAAYVRVIQRLRHAGIADPD